MKFNVLPNEKLLVNGIEIRFHSQYNEQVIVEIDSSEDIEIVEETNRLTKYFKNLEN